MATTVTTGTPHFNVFCFIDLHWYSVFVFNKLRFCGKPSIKKIYWCHFSSLCSCSGSVSHYGNSENILNSSFYYVCCDDLWWVIFDVTSVTVSGQQESHSFQTVNLTCKCCVCWLLHWLAIPPSLSLTLGQPISWDTTVLKFGH